MTLLFTDLDNTVIYSHRHKIDEPKRWVEILNNQNQSFITEKTYRFYEKQNWLKVVPVTTRTYEQYSRLNGLTQPLGWNIALICNGAVLLRDNKEDRLWTKDSLKLSENGRPAFMYAYKKICKLLGSDLVKYVEPFFFYVKTEEPEKIFSFLSHYADLSSLSVFRAGQKVYCMPQSLSKGNAVKRFMNRFGWNFCIAAGDSPLDVSMLDKADICFCPQGISGQLKAEGSKVVCEGIFSDRVCDGLRDLKKERENIV